MPHFMRFCRAISPDWCSKSVSGVRRPGIWPFVPVCLLATDDRFSRSMRFRTSVSQHKEDLQRLGEKMNEARLSPGSLRCARQQAGNSGMPCSICHCTERCRSMQDLPEQGFAPGTPLFVLACRYRLWRRAKRAAISFMCKASCVAKN